MDINKALTLAKNLRNHFKVFEELEEFMREAVALQNVVKEFESRKATLQKDMETLQDSKAAFLKHMANLEGQKKADFEKISNGLEDKIKRKSIEIEVDIEKMEAEKDKIRASLEEAEAHHRGKMEQIGIEREKAEETLRAVEKKIRDIKAKLE